MTKKLPAEKEAFFKQELEKVCKNYFLYDWHEKDDSHKWHGFHHAKKALENALEDFKLNEIERDIIACHMFPLNIRPPKYRESWLVCYADKVCSGLETVKRKKS